MTNDEILDSETVSDENEPPALDGMLQNLMQDILTDEPAETLADEFVEDFVLAGRPETGQVLALLDMPDETLIAFVEQLQLQTLEQLKQKAPAYLSELRAAIASRLAEIAKS